MPKSIRSDVETTPRDAPISMARWPAVLPISMMRSLSQAGVRKKGHHDGTQNEPMGTCPSITMKAAARRRVASTRKSDSGI